MTLKSLSVDGRRIVLDLGEPLVIPIEWLARVLAVALLGRYPVFAEVLVQTRTEEARVSQAEAAELARAQGGLETLLRDEHWRPWLARFVRTAQDADPRVIG